MLAIRSALHRFSYNEINLFRMKKYKRAVGVELQQRNSTIFIRFTDILFIFH